MDRAAKLVGYVRPASDAEAAARLDESLRRHVAPRIPAPAPSAELVAELEAAAASIGPEQKEAALAEVEEYVATLPPKPSRRARRLNATEARQVLRQARDAGPLGEWRLDALAARQRQMQLLTTLVGDQRTEQRTPFSTAQLSSHNGTVYVELSWLSSRLWRELRARLGVPARLAGDRLLRIAWTSEEWRRPFDEALRAIATEMSLRVPTDAELRRRATLYLYRHGWKGPALVREIMQGTHPALRGLYRRELAALAEAGAAKLIANAAVTQAARSLDKLVARARAPIPRRRGRLRSSPP